MSRRCLHTQWYAKSARHRFYVDFKESITCTGGCESRIVESYSSHGGAENWEQVEKDWWIFGKWEHKCDHGIDGSSVLYSRGLRRTDIEYMPCFHNL